MQIKLSQYIADFLVAHGVKHNFTVTGGGAMHLNDALGHKAGLTSIYNHHEQGSAIAAEAYARLTGEVACVCVTSGPGGTNAITGVMGGWVDSIPMLILSGQVKRETTIWSVPGLPLRQLGDQEFDITHSIANMTKYCAMVTAPEKIAYHLEKAWFLCHAGRPGPVWLDIPLDVQGAMIETDSLPHFDAAAEGYTAVPPISAALAQTILEKLRTAKAPVLLVGTGVRVAGAYPELQALIEKLHIPVVTAWNANDTVPFEDPHFAGMPGTVGTRGGNFVVQNADVLLSLACRLNIRMISYNKHDFAKNAYKIIVDVDENELKKPTITPDLPVCGDVKQVLQAMLAQDYTPNPAHAPWLAWCRAINAKYPAALPEYRHAGAPINPYIFNDLLFTALAPSDQIACGNGSACVVTFQGCKIKPGQRMFTNSGCAAMGYGLPAALGMAVARPEKRTICIDGDGSIMMNLQELETIAYNHLNVKIVLLSNHGYHSIRQTQQNLFKGRPLVGVSDENGVGMPDFAKLAEAFGFAYYRLDREEDAQDTLRTALSAEGPVFLEAVTDPAQNFAPKLSSKVLPDGRIVSPSLDDMFPFLPRAEYEADRYMPQNG
ncbi:MAG: thiamine pyrophosphate-binding protein [Faecalibacterium sp.]|jgi:acetolactate synthase-1/2/3 large subunit|nr:thiamine pyrophosphate-binding protein [Faecalibacterium sp.]